MTPSPERILLIALTPKARALGARLAQALSGAELPDLAPGAAIQTIASGFASGQAVIGICAAGILIRAVAPFLADKRAEPPVLAVAEDGSAVVPLLGGHHGGNDLARRVAVALGIDATLLTASDLSLGVSLDEPPAGWRLGNPDRVKPAAMALLNGAGARIDGDAPWLDRLPAASGTASVEIRITPQRLAPDETVLTYHPASLALGIGCERGCAASELIELAEASLADAGLAAQALACIVSIELKSDETAIHALARHFGVPARFFTASRLAEETPRLATPSEAVYRATGCWGVAEGAALAAAGADGILLVPKRKSTRATIAVAAAPGPIDPTMIGRARGRLCVLGIGPGDAAWRTPAAEAALAAATQIVGHRLYLDLLGEAIAGKAHRSTALGEEAGRARLALDLAAQGETVALVSSGDAGIYGMATLVFELIDREDRPEWRRIELEVSPGISALQAAAARAGAPLGHDFCAISLSDLLTPWAAIEARLAAAAAADFVVALYNPRSARRLQGLAAAKAILLRHRPADTPVVLARNVGRAAESLAIVPLAELDPAAVDMLTLVLVGATATRRVAGTPWIYTPRGYAAKPP
jgi:cobalt-precorrin 5A hydrolase / precorrin-3B C17-methyltransferase